MADRRTLSIWIISSAILTLVAACSPTTRYRVARFFFDGVPEPGASDSSAPESQPAKTPPQAPGDRAPRGRIVYAHPPYRENRCRACHNPDDGLLYRELADGLCQTCHPDVPGPTAYLHGPVAVNGCLSCHHYHDSIYPGLLLDEAKALCFRCHKRTDLTKGAHHDEIEARSCIECHYAHGGSDRFLLRRSTP